MSHAGFRDHYRDPLGLRVGVGLAALGVVLDVAGVWLWHWFLVGGIPLILIGGAGWLMEMSRPKSPKGEQAEQ